MKNSKTPGGKKKVILRADGNLQIGLGHVYRLLALAEILEEEFDCVFVTANPPAHVRQLIKNPSLPSILIETSFQYPVPAEMSQDDELPFDLNEIINSGEIVVIDGYLFGKQYQQAVQAKGAKVVCIDDLASAEFPANAVINHAPGIDASWYKVQPYTKLYSGLDYAMLRIEFFKPFPTIKPENLHAYVSLGGSDYYGYTATLTALLVQLEKFETLHVLCSSSFSEALINDLEQMQQLHCNVQLHFNVNATQLVQLLDSCTHAFVSASTVLLEAFARGLVCFAGYYVNNQKFIYEGFTQKKLAVPIGDFKSLNKEAVEQSWQLQAQVNPLASPLSSAENLRKIFRDL